MINTSQNQLTNNQAMFILFSAIVGIGVLSLPQAVGKVAGGDAWISVLIGGVAPLLAVVTMSLVGRRLPGKTLAEMTDCVFGVYLGKLFCLLYVVWVLALLVVDLRYFVFIINGYLLVRTPAWLIILITLASVSYLAVAGAKIVGRVCELVFYLALPAYLLVLFVLREASLVNLLPIGDAGFKTIMQGAWGGALAYSGATVWLVIIPFITNQQKTIRTGLKAIALTIATYLFFTVMALSVFGEGIDVIRWPTLMLLKSATVPVIERLEFIFILIWVPTVYRLLAVSWWAAAFSFTRMFKWKDHRPVVLTLLPILFIVTVLPQDIFMLDKYGEWVGAAGIGIDLLLPLCLLVGALLRRKGGKYSA